MTPARRTPPRDGDIKERIEIFLGEFRMIIPAFASVLGFQLIVAFQDSYRTLSQGDRTAHFAGLACTAIALLFLILPASYHRFIRRLEETEDFLSYARRSVSIAFVFMPLGITLSIYVQARRTFESPALSLLVGCAFLAAYVLAWWILPYRRARRKRLVPRHSGKSHRD